MYHNDQGDQSMSGIESDASLKQPPQYDEDKAIRRVTARQLLEADQMHASALFTIEGKAFKTVILVGNICSFRTSTASTDFELDDGTGRIKAKQWNRYLEYNRGQPDVRGFPYVRVIGELELYRNEKQLKVICLETTPSAYEPYHHILHAIRDTLVYEFGPPPLTLPITRANQTADGSLEEVETTDTPFSELIVSSEHAPLLPEPESPNNRAMDWSSHALSPRLPVLDSPMLVDKSKGKAKADENENEQPNIGESWSIHGYYKDNIADRVPKTPTKPSRQPSSGKRRSPISISPEVSPLPPSTKRQSSSKRDPYSNLTSLEREILLFLQTTGGQEAERSRMYPSVNELPIQREWEGTHVSLIINAVKLRRPKLTSEQFMRAIEYLLKEGYIFNPISVDHYCKT